MTVLKVARVMEKVWLVLAIVLGIFAAYKTYDEGFDSGRMYILMFVIAIIWYTVRVGLRKRMEAKMNEDIES